MKFIDPITGVGDAKLAYAAGVLAIEVNGGTPVGANLAGEILRRKFGDVVAIRAEVVVHDIQDYAEFEGMGAIHKPAKVVGSSVEMRGREQLDAIVTPTETAREFSYGHHFQNGHARFSELRQMLLSAAPGTFLGKRADMHFINHLAGQRGAAPFLVGPFEYRGVDNFCWAVGAFGLET